jgi:hypothetical protein
MLFSAVKNYLFHPHAFANHKKWPAVETAGHQLQCLREKCWRTDKAILIQNTCLHTKKNGPEARMPASNRFH